MYHDALCLFGASYSKQRDFSGGIWHIEKGKRIKQKREEKGVIKKCIEYYTRFMIMESYPRIDSVLS